MIKRGILIFVLCTILISFAFALPIFLESGTLSISIGGLPEITVLSPENITYSFTIGESYNLSLNVSSNSNLSWKYSLIDLTNNTFVYTNLVFGPNITFIAVRNSNKIMIYANDSSNTVNTNITFYVYVPEPASFVSVVHVGGGGGLTVSKKPCNDKWVCGAWEECRNAEKSFNNGTLVIDDYNRIRDDCLKNRLDDSSCGFQSRSCDEVNACNTTLDKYLEMRACYYEQPTCKDEVKNQNEEGIDCGGVCPACPKLEVPYLSPYTSYAIYGYVAIGLVLMIVIILIIIVPYFRKNTRIGRQIEKAKEFVSDARAKGYTKEQIKNMFRNKGWKENDIGRIFR